MTEFIQSFNNGFCSKSLHNEGKSQADQCCMSCTMALRQLITCNNCYSKLGSNLICMLMTQMCKLLEPEVKFAENNNTYSPQPIKISKRASLCKSKLNEPIILKKNKLVKLPEINGLNLNKNIGNKELKVSIARSTVEDSLNFSNSTNIIAQNMIDENGEYDGKRFASTTKKELSVPINPHQSLKIPSLCK